MKILFSPAESKKSGGVDGEINRDSFLFPELFAYTKEALDRYNSFINSATDEELSKLFGIKEPSKFAKYRVNIYDLPLMKAIERYDGVAYDYLEYASLQAEEQKYIDENVLIFSNLFGVVRANEALPEYKMKQGEKIDGFAPEDFYKKHFTKALDAFLSDAPFLDLRAGFYDKFYKSTTPYVTLKFLKNGKVVSHWAKAYRGSVLRELAKNRVETMDAFMKMQIQNLQVKEILKKGIHTEIVYEIME